MTSAGPGRFLLQIDFLEFFLSGVCSVEWEDGWKFELAFKSLKCIFIPRHGS